MENLKQSKKQINEDSPFNIKDWLIRQTKKEEKKKVSFDIAMKKARNKDKRAGRYLKKRYNMSGVWDGEKVVKF